MTNYRPFPHQVSFLKSLLTAFGIVYCLAMAGCTNTYDWRIVKSDEYAYEALYPGKPSRAEQSIAIGDQKYAMVMEAASAGKALFAVGVITLDANAKNADEILLWLKNSTSRNLTLDRKPEEQQNLKFKVAGSSQEVIVAEGVKMQGIGPDKIQRIFWVRWLKRTDNAGVQRIYQLSVIQPFEKMPDQNQLNQLEEQYETFYAGFHPY
jgi:hypothetical protein